MSDRNSAIVPYVSPPAIISAHNARGYTTERVDAPFHHGHVSSDGSVPRCRLAIGTTPAQEAERLGPDALATLRAAHAARKTARVEISPVEAIAAKTEPDAVIAPSWPDSPAPDPGPAPRDIDVRVGQALTRYKGRVAMFDAACTRVHEVDVSMPDKPRPSIDDIQRLVAARYSVTVTDIISSRRTAILVKPRQVAMFLAKSVTLRSLPEIGKKFGDRDHTTVLHGTRKIEALCAKDASFREEVEDLRRLLLGEIESLPMRELSLQGKRGYRTIGEKILIAMRAGARTSEEVAVALDITVHSAAGAMSRLIRSGKVVHVRKVMRGFYIYALSEGDA